MNTYYLLQLAAGVLADMTLPVFYLFHATDAGEVGQGTDLYVSNVAICGLSSLFQLSKRISVRRFASIPHATMEGGSL
ncbi:hypothetical protein BJ166DRAFT_544474 [Pestalotiopsis sp. NC0098]|nr:hypothetical protein BJ166DRAFT_544474 [Pestalotiopsis sp. NC0098]